MSAKTIKPALILLSATALVACEAENETVAVIEQEAFSCADISQLAPQGVLITQAQVQAATEEIPVAHCIVQGQIEQRTGTDGKDYAISFELRLPDQWSGQFVHQFNGGNDGSVVPATGRMSVMAPNDSALARGFAVVSSDAGHDGRAYPEAGLAGSNRFGMEPEARRDYGYGAVESLHPAATALTEAYYQSPIQYTYGLGSSNGGRHAMVAASRIPEQFDGFIAGYPGFNLPKAAVQHAWDVQNFRSVGDVLQESFSREELNLVADYVATACDAYDSLQDGIIFDVQACQAVFDPAVMSCETSASDECLPAEKVAALTNIIQGPTNSAGDQLYSEWAWDTGLSSGGWRSWKLQSGVPPWDGQPIIAIMGAGSLAQVFTTPPTPLEGNSESLEQYLLDFDFEVDAPKIYATSLEFPESAMEMMTPPDADNPTLSGLENSGGKMLIFHGVSDPVFSFMDTVNWYENLLVNNPDATDFVTLYAVPGMPHGPGGVAPDQFDPLSVLVDWVENNETPGTINASIRADNQEAPEALRGVTRKLCRWPAVARYTGPDPASAESFACVTTLE